MRTSGTEMKSTAEFNQKLERLKAAKPTVVNKRMETTRWGYVVAEPSRFIRHQHFVERIAWFSGGLLIALAALQWIGPISQWGWSLIAMKLGLTVCFTIVGFALASFATNGIAGEMQMDLSERELRVATRNRFGDTKVHETVPFEEIESVYMRRAATAGAPGFLCLRRTDGSELVVLRDGDAALKDVWGRMNEDLHQQPRRPKVALEVAKERRKSLAQQTGIALQ